MVLVDTSTTWGREIINGVIRFTNRRPLGRIFVEARGMQERLRVPKTVNVQGVIARVRSDEMASDLKAMKVPVVNVSGIKLTECVFPQVTSNMRKVAELAVEHFVEKGFLHFGYFGLKGLRYVTEQQHQFEEKVSQMGYSCASFRETTHRGVEPDWCHNRELLLWIKELPKPVGIFSWNASSAREILYACLDAGLRVPDEVAILSGSEDDLLCQAAPIPISAVVPATQLLGFRATEVLHNLIRGGPSQSEPILIPPIGVKTRQSTEILAVQDPALVKALNFLSQNPDKQINVDYLARQAGVSRRALERRFRDVLKRTPADEIRRVRLETARRLLAETDLPISAVADALGFESQGYFASLHRRYFKKSPIQYRLECRPR